MQDEKSQLQNRDKAMRVLRARLYEQALAEQQAELAADRLHAGRDGRRARRRSGPTTTASAASPTTASSSPSTTSTPCSWASSTSSPSALQADEKRRRLEAQAAAWRERRAGRDALATATARLDAAGCGHASARRRAAARRALARIDRAAPGARPRASRSTPEASALRGAGRAPGSAREPVAYILGRRGFRYLELQVDPRVLVPRPETEHAGRDRLSELPHGARVLDVGTGSGAVALALRRTSGRDLDVTGTDASDDALEVARANAARLGLEVVFAHGDLLEAMSDAWDAVLANLPYIAEGDRDSLPPELGFEPDSALFAGADGLDVIRRLVVAAAQRAPWLAIEVGAGQAPEVAASCATRAMRPPRLSWTSPASSASSSAAGERFRGDDPSAAGGVVPVPVGHRLRPRVRPGVRVGGRAALRAEGPRTGQARGSDVLVAGGSARGAAGAGPAHPRRPRGAASGCAHAAGAQSGGPLPARLRPGHLNARRAGAGRLRNRPGAVLQSSANPSGEPDARRLSDVAESIRAHATSCSTAASCRARRRLSLDLRDLEEAGIWTVLREGAVPTQEIRASLAAS